MNSSITSSSKQRASQSVDDRINLALDAGAIAGTWYWSVQDDVFTADSRFAHYFSLDEQALEAGMPLARVVQSIHPDDEPLVQRLIGGALQRGGPYRAEYRVMQRDGSYRWVEANGRVDMDGQGLPLSFPGVLMDIDYRKRNEVFQKALVALGDELRELEDEDSIVRVASRICAQAVNASCGGYGAVNASSTHVRVAADWCREDYIRSVAGNYRFADFGSFIDDLRQGVVVAIDDVVHDARTREQAGAFEQLRIRGMLNLPLIRDGRLAGVFLLHDTSPRTWAEDEVIFVRSVADRTWAALATADALTKLRTLNAGLERKVATQADDRDRLWNLSRDMLLVAQFDGRILAVNPAWEATLGWTERELLAWSFFDLIHPDDLERTYDGARAITLGATFPHFENRYRHKDGSYRLISWSAGPAVGCLIATGRDITAIKDQEASLRQAEDQLRQSQKMEAVGQLTGGIAHDFNNLLTIISTSVQLLQRRPGLDERGERYLGSISNAVSRASTLTGQLLAFARRQSLEPVVFDATQNIAAIAEMVKTLVGTRIALNLPNPGADCWVDADPGQFDTAIINMAANARDAMDGEGCLSIETRRVSGLPAVRSHAAISGDFIAISVRDTGSGIPADRLEKVFEPFYTTKPVGHGTGLGLSQVFGFAKQSGGDVLVHSELGKGTTFTIFLPISGRLKDVVVGGDHGRMENEPPIHGRVLVVEDNQLVAVAAHDSLNALGYEVTVVYDSTEALAQLAEHPNDFCAVFSDVMMAGVNGLELAKVVRQQHPQLPILLSSGYNSVLASSQGHGFPLLPKPYNLETLGAALDSAMRSMTGKAAGAGEADAAMRSDAVEKARLADLLQLAVLDTPEEASYDEIAQRAAELFHAPMAMVSLVDGRRQWFKASRGISLKETAREIAFCDTALRTPDEVLVVSDTAAHPDFARNPLVTAEPMIRFYAGAPLVTSLGNPIGTVCVLDTVPHTVDDDRLEGLKLLAKQAVERLERDRPAPCFGV